MDRPPAHLGSGMDILIFDLAPHSLCLVAIILISPGCMISSSLTSNESVVIKKCSDLEEFAFVNMPFIAQQRLDDIEIATTETAPGDNQNNKEGLHIKNDAYFTQLSSAMRMRDNNDRNRPPPAADPQVRQKLQGRNTDPLSCKIALPVHQMDGFFIP